MFSAPSCSHKGQKYAAFLKRRRDAEVIKILHMLLVSLMHSSILATVIPRLLLTAAVIYMATTKGSLTHICLKGLFPQMISTTKLSGRDWSNPPSFGLAGLTELLRRQN